MRRYLPTSQTAIPCHLMRGGTSKGPFFYRGDLPSDTAARDAVLLAAMGSPDLRQIDGLGGAHPLTSKAGIVDRSQQPDIDLEFFFAQLQPDTAAVDTKPNCGNMLAAVVPFAIERGLITPANGTTTARVLTLNTNMLADITVQTPNGILEYEGGAHIDGVPASAAPIEICFLNTEGSIAGSLLPTGNAKDRFRISGLGEIEATCIDNGMPMVLVRAQDFHRSAQESVAALNQDDALKCWLEQLRLMAAEKMGLGCVREKNYPKMCLIAEPVRGGTLHTRCFIPRVCHDAIGVLAAVTVATACLTAGSVADGIACTHSEAGKIHASIEHPSGEFTVTLHREHGRITRAALLRTARALMRGEVLIPSRYWSNQHG